MKMFETLMAEPWFLALGWALAHFIWQGALAALLLACFRLSLRSSTARVRYTVNCFFLAALLAMPLLTFVVSIERSQAMASGAAWTEISSLPGVFVTGPPTSTSVVSPSGIPSPIEPFLPWFVGFWLGGVILLSVHWLAAWAYLHRLRRAVSYLTPPEWAVWEHTLRNLKQRLSMTAPVRLCMNGLAEAPSVIGWLRPVILIPAATVAGLDLAAMEAVLAHELAHIRRHDYLVNLFQAVAETLLFYHPAVWWVSKQIRIERENCCDDVAAEICGNRVVYARALVDLEQIRISRPSLALAANGGSLMDRVKRLLHASETDQQRAPGWLSALAASAGLAAVVLILAAARPAAHALDGVTKYSAAVAEQDTPASPATAPAAPGKPLRPTPLARPAPTAPHPAVESFEEPGEKEDFIAGMAAAGFPNLSVDQLIELRQHDVTPKFAREMRAAGFANIKPEQLIELRNHGVDAEFIQSLKENGLGSLSLDGVMALATHGVDADFIAEINKEGFNGLSADDYERLRMHGVDGDYIQGMKAAGFTKLSLNDLVSLRNQGVDHEFIAEIKSAGFTGLSADDYRQLRMHGVDGDYIKGMKTAGLGDLSRDDLVKLRNQGVDPEFIAEIKSAGFTGLAASDYQRLRMHGVDGDFIHGMKAAGLGKLTLDELVSLRNQGVDPEFISEMKGAGYPGLSAEQYKQLRRHGVDAEFVQHLKEHGITNVSVEQLIRLRQSGM